MTKFFPTLLLLLILSGFRVFSQNLSLGIQTGIGFYDMSDLKALNEKVFESLPFKAKVISGYPPYSYYKPALLLTYKKFNIGIVSAYYSTGSRISSQDYSGEYLFDTRINCIAPGLYSDVLLFSSLKKYDIWLSLDGGFTFSNMRLKENLTVLDQELTNSSYKFKSQNYFIEPGFKFEYNIYRFIFAQLNTSYFVQFGKNVLVSREGEIMNDGKKVIGPDWNGLRIGLTIIIRTPAL